MLASLANKVPRFARSSSENVCRPPARRGIFSLCVAGGPGAPRNVWGALPPYPPEMEAVPFASPVFFRRSSHKKGERSEHNCFLCYNLNMQKFFNAIKKIFTASPKFVRLCPGKRHAWYSYKGQIFRKPV